MSALSVHQLARADVRALPLYSPDGIPGIVDLSDNTNLWGAPPAALRVLRDAPASALSRYPSLYSAELRAAIVRYVGLEPASAIDVVTGCGSDDILDSTMRAFGGQGERIAFSAPTFSMIPTLAGLNGLESVGIPFTRDFGIDAERLVDCGAKITYLCTPNNPTATAASRKAVEHVVTHAPGIVLLDEAYAEFAPETFVDLVGGNDRLIVARTFSKAFGLAGLRVGYGIGSYAITDLVARARGPYKVNSIAERAVLATLDATRDGLDWVREKVTLAIAHRARLADALAGLGFLVLPTAANFVLVPTRQAAELCGSLRARGVLVRALADLPRSLSVFEESEGRALRIGVGPWEMMQTLIDALADVLSCE
jgi:histidinol-phosphate aminotransferase